MLLKRITIALTLLILAGCATMPAKKPPYNQHMSWQTRQTQLNTVTSWELQGAIGVRAPSNSGSANVIWQQHDKDYDIRLFGPLGAGNTQISGGPDEVTLRSKGKTQTAASPEALLYQELGWYVPISHMYYWVRGLPAPNLQRQSQFDEYNHLIKLQQNGWTISYDRYTGIHGMDLPSRITMTNPDLRVRIVIKKWQPKRQ